MLEENTRNTRRFDTLKLALVIGGTGVNLKHKVALLWSEAGINEQIGACPG